MKDMGTLNRNDDTDRQLQLERSDADRPHRQARPGRSRQPHHLLAAATSRSSTSTYPANAVPNGYYQTTGPLQPSNDYFTLSGTSMAAPMVSGTAALMLQKDPALSPDTVKARLMKTATKAFPAFSSVTDPATGQTYISQYDIFTIGAGYLDAWAALNCSDTAAGVAASPKRSLRPGIWAGPRRQ